MQAFLLVVIRCLDDRCSLSTSAGRCVGLVVVVLLMSVTRLEEQLARLLASVDVFDVGLTQVTRIESGALLSSFQLKVLVVQMVLFKW